MVKVLISDKKIEAVPENDGKKNDGAELIFNGRVRAQENGKQVIALFYEQYPKMALAEMKKLAQETEKNFAIHDLYCIHRVGYIPVGETSLRVVIWSKHRKEAIKALDWFITEIKQRLPIWKWGVMEDGKRFPSS
jgi:molybdopterin synthase catalytic subunit